MLGKNLGFCPQCIHGREQGDYEEITLRNGGEMLLLLGATILGAEAIREKVAEILRRLPSGSGQPESVIDFVDGSFIQVDLTGQRGWTTLGVVVRTYKNGRRFLVPSRNPKKVLCVCSQDRRSPSVA